MLPKSLRPLFPYLKKYRGSYFIGTICVLSITASGFFFHWCFAGPSMACRAE